MARLGDFTPAVSPADELTFGYFGSEMRVHPDFGELGFVDWAEEYGSLPEGDTRALTATKVLMQAVVHPDDFPGFWRLARTNRQGSEDLAKVFQFVLEAISERPTRPQSGSLHGETTTRPNSGADSYSRAIAEFETKGRPDLALIIDHARSVRTA